MYNGQPNEHFKESGNIQSRHEPIYRKRRQQYRKEIRRNELDEKIKSMREEMLKDMHFNQVVEGISVYETLTNFESLLNQGEIETSWEQLVNLAKDMYILSVFGRQSRINQLLGEQMIHKMADLLAIHNVQKFSRRPQTYIEILRILEKITAYFAFQDEISREIVSMVSIRRISEVLLVQLFNVRYHCPQQGRFKIFTYPQTLVVLHVALSIQLNLSMNDDILLQMCLDPLQQIEQSLVAVLIKEFSNIIGFAHQEQGISDFNAAILDKIVRIFQSVLIFYTDEEVMPELYQLDRRIVDLILKMLEQVCKQDIQQRQQQHCTKVLKCFLNKHLFRQPQIVISHDFSLLFVLFDDIASSLASEYRNNSEVDKQEGNLLQERFNLQIIGLNDRRNILLDIFDLLFNLKIPEENSERYEQVYGDWLGNFIIPFFHKVFGGNGPSFDKSNYKVMQFLGTICLSERHCELLIGEPLIINKIFYYINSNQISYYLKLGALDVLNKIIWTALPQQSRLRGKVIRLLEDNKIMEIWVEKIGQLNDYKFDLDLLDSLYFYLQTQVSQNGNHILWAQFCSYGGLTQLQKKFCKTIYEEIQEAIRIIIGQYTGSSAEKVERSDMNAQEQGQGKWLSSISPDLIKLTGRPATRVPLSTSPRLPLSPSRPVEAEARPIVLSQHSSTSSYDTPTFVVPSQNTSTHHDG